MNTYYLPDDLLDNSAAGPDEVVIRYYSANRDSVKNRIVLNQNMINLPAEIRLLRIEELLLYLFQSDPERFHAIEILTRDKQQLQIRKVVESQIGQPTTVDDLAFLCHMSTSTFKRKFSEIYQTSPQKWLLARRLELAADLLRSFDESPSGIYMKVGYQNHSSFSEAFRNHFGSTPSDFQQKHLNVRP
ncbi:helix-turn-helix domain-containing protein [Dyadobacter alkalitolerans]|uniref:helix-turn-helix domain-containing protein n=1 Tax=Dyadobacter alkalitolerans TaxID=492736 RepID=UPI000401CACE|nr:AraC family transcriptional regulator [Dyadobacter alkalitolerans]